MIYLICFTKIPPAHPTLCYLGFIENINALIIHIYRDLPFQRKSERFNTKETIEILNLNCV